MHLKVKILVRGFTKLKILIEVMDKKMETLDRTEINFFEGVGSTERTLVVSVFPYCLVCRR